MIFWHKYTLYKAPTLSNYKSKSKIEELKQKVDNFTQETYKKMMIWMKT